MNPLLEYLNILVVVWAFVLSFAFYVMYLSDLSTGSFDRGVHLFTVVDYRTGEMVNPGYTLVIMKKREDGNHNWCFNYQLPKLKDWKKEWDFKEVRATAATVNRESFRPLPFALCNVIVPTRYLS